jgi:hypothetical protein
VEASHMRLRIMVNDALIAGSPARAPLPMP